jgi:hypothetical protein
MTGATRHRRDFSDEEAATVYRRGYRDEISAAGLSSRTFYGAAFTDDERRLFTAPNIEPEVLNREPPWDANQKWSSQRDMGPPSKHYQVSSERKRNPSGRQLSL